MLSLCFRKPLIQGMVLGSLMLSVDYRVPSSRKNRLKVIATVPSCDSKYFMVRRPKPSFGIPERNLSMKMRHPVFKIRVHLTHLSGS